MKKLLSLIGLITLVLIMFNACAIPAKYQWKISNQLDTQWISEDGTIVFNVNDKYMITGTMEVNGETIEVFVATEPERGMGLHIYPIGDLEDGVLEQASKYEKWQCSYKSDNKFVATVKQTTFYEVGQKITFSRLD